MPKRSWSLLKRRAGVMSTRAGVYAVPGTAYGTNGCRIISVPCDYVGRPFYVRWQAFLEAVPMDLGSVVAVYVEGEHGDAGEAIESAIAGEFTSSVYLDRRELVKAIREIGSPQDVALEVLASEIIVRGCKVGAASASIPAQLEGRPGVVLLSARYLRDAARIAGDPLIRLDYDDVGWRARVVVEKAVGSQPATEWIAQLDPRRIPYLDPHLARTSAPA